MSRYGNMGVKRCVITSGMQTNAIKQHMNGFNGLKFKNIYFQNFLSQVQPTSQTLHVAASDVLTQFILDCTSINLDDSIRVPAHNPGIDKLFQVSRDWCFALSNERSRLLYKENKKK